MKKIGHMALAAVLAPIIAVLSFPGLVVLFWVLLIDDCGLRDEDD